MPLPLLAVLCLTLLLAMVPTRGVAADPDEEARQTILILGDSISAGYGIQREQGWVHLLDEALVAQELGARTLNASVSGETTSGALARLPALLEEHAPEVVVIELGGNDGLRGYPVARMRDNLTRMVHLAREAGARPVIMEMRIPPNYGPRYTRDFQAAFTTVAQAEAATLIPFFLESIALEDGMMQSDGIHPTAAAQRAMLDAAWPYLRALVMPGGTEVGAGASAY